jgi:hypothetical protein
MSSQSPTTNWGYIKDWESFKYHVTGQQFSTWVFAKGAAKKQLGVFFNSLLHLTSVPLLIFVPALVNIFKNNIRVAFIILLSFLGCLLWAINYDIADIDSYFILAYYAMVLAAGHFCYYFVAQKKKAIKFVSLGVLIVFLIQSVTYNLIYNNYSQDFLFEAYTKDVLLSAEPNAIIESKQWDHWVASSWYFQRVEKLRTDITVVDKELMRRIWYLNYLQDKSGWLFKGYEDEVNTFKKDLYPFEHSKTYDQVLLQAGYVNVLSKVLSEHYKNRPVYITPELMLEEVQKNEIKNPEGSYWVPMGLYLKLIPNDTIYHPAPWPKHLAALAEKPIVLKTMYHKQATSLSATCFLWRAQYENRMKKPEEAQRWITLAANTDTTIILPPDLAQYQITKRKKAN